MEQGVLQQYAPPAALKETPANLFVASFIGEPPMNILDAGLAGAAGTGLVGAPDGDPPCACLGGADGGPRRRAGARRRPQARHPPAPCPGRRPARAGGDRRLQPVAGRPGPPRPRPRRLLPRRGRDGRSARRSAIGSVSACRSRPCTCSTPRAAGRWSTDSARRPPRHEPGRPDRVGRRDLGHQGRGVRLDGASWPASAGLTSMTSCPAAPSSRTWPAPGPTAAGAARPGRRRPAPAQPGGGARGDRPGRRHLAVRRGRRAGGARWLADSRAGIARAGPQRRARARLPPYRLRHERLQPVGPAPLAQAPCARGAGPRRHRLPLQGLALPQAHRRAGDRRVGGHLHLRSATSAPAPTPEVLAALGSKASGGSCPRWSTAGPRTS